MKIKTSKEIINEIEQRGKICIPAGCVTGEEFEKYLKIVSNDVWKNESNK